MPNILKSVWNRFRKARAEALVVQNQVSATEPCVTAAYTPVAQESSTGATLAAAPAVEAAPAAVEAAPTIQGFRPEGFVVCCGNHPIIADVVFVHGLGGDRVNTWTKSNVFWPRDLLPKSIGNLRILSFGYDSDVAKFFKSAGIDSIHNHAENLIQDLCNQRVSVEEAARPIIFVVHSLGGIVLKHALAISEREQNFNPIKFSIFSCTRGVIFLATPHRGASAASWAKMAADILGTIIHTNSKVLNDLERDSTVLQILSRPFAQLAAKQTFAVFSFAESREMGRTVIVDQGSAYLGDVYEVQGTINADHQQICKFSDPASEGYGRVVAAISQVILKLREQGEVQRRACLDTLDFPEYRRAVAAIPDAYSDTCQWILTDSSWLKWLQCQESHLLFVPGPAGSGKSVLAKFVLKWLQLHKALNSKIAYFFFSSTGRAAQPLMATTEGLCQALLHELLQCPEDFQQSDLAAKYEVLKQDGLTAWTYEALSSILLKMRFSHPKKTTYIVVDALDECAPSQKWQVLGLLKQLVSTKLKNRAIFKIFLTGQPSSTLQIENPDGSGTTAKPNKDARLRDIRHYLQLEFERLSDTHPGPDYAPLEKAILASCKDVFLWVAIVVHNLEQELRNGWTPMILQSILYGLPEKLTELYAKLLSISKERNKGNYGETMKMLEWVILARRSLTLSEFNILFAFQHCLGAQGSLDGIRSLENIRQSQFPNAVELRKRIAHTCAGLLVVRPDPTDDWNSHIELIHDSARIYLQSSETGPCLGDANGECQMAVLCARYLTMADFRSGPQNHGVLLRHLSNFPLLAYASRFWLVHADEVYTGSNEDAQMTMSVIQMLFERGPNLYAWYQIYALLDRSRTLDRGSAYQVVPPICLAAEVLSLPALQQLLRRTVPLGTCDQDGRTALHTAILSSFNERKPQTVTRAIQLLLEHCPSDLNVQDHFQNAPLHLAIECSNEALVQQLLRSQDIDLEIRNTSGLTPILLAADHTLPRIVRILLVKGADSKKVSHEGFGICMLSDRRGDTHTKNLMNMWDSGGDVWQMRLPAPEDEWL